VRLEGIQDLTHPLPIGLCEAWKTEAHANAIDASRNAGAALIRRDQTAASDLFQQPPHAVVERPTLVRRPLDSIEVMQ
jgi:hypothetical protein